MLYRWILAALSALSADPDAVDLERPRAAAAVAVAYASMLTPEPMDEPAVGAEKP